MFHIRKKILPDKLNEEQNSISKKISGLKFKDRFAQYVLYTLSELFATIHEHSKARNAFVEIKIDKQNYFMKICNDGIGLTRSYILKKIYPKDDFSAIEFALSGLSTKHLKERGFGLYSVKKLTLALKGKMVIESGRASAIIKSKEIKFNNLKQRINGLTVTLHAKISEIDFYKYIE